MEEGNRDGEELGGKTIFCVCVCVYTLYIHISVYIVFEKNLFSIKEKLF